MFYMFVVIVTSAKEVKFSFVSCLFAVLLCSFSDQQGYAGIVPDRFAPISGEGWGMGPKRIPSILVHDPIKGPDPGIYSSLSLLGIFQHF